MQVFIENYHAKCNMITYGWFWPTSFLLVLSNSPEENAHKNNNNIVREFKVKIGTNHHFVIQIQLYSMHWLHHNDFSLAA